MACYSCRLIVGNFFCDGRQSPTGTGLEEIDHLEQASTSQTLGSPSAPKISEEPCEWCTPVHEAGAVLPKPASTKNTGAAQQRFLS